MNFATLYRISFYLMLTVASLVLSVDATDSKLAMLYPVAVAAASVFALLTVDRNPSRGLSPSASTALGFVSMGLAAFEWQQDPNLLLLALGHWVVYLQLIYMFSAKTVRTDWYMFGLGLIQVMLGTVISQSDAVGSLLFAWAVLSLWVLGLFSLRRDAARASERATAGSAPADVEPYPGLLNLPFIVSALRVTLTTLALGGVIFLAMPRKQTMARSQRGEVKAQHLTGFDDEVQLGQMGEILENDSVVLSVETYDENDRRVEPQAESLWRGVTMAIYENGRWTRQAKRGSTVPTTRPDPLVPQGKDRPSGYVRQEIKLEANDSNVLFALRPVAETSAPGRRLPPELNSVDGTVFRVDSRPGTYDYTVISYRDPEVPQPGERAPSSYRRNVLLLGLPEALRPRLKAIAEQVLATRLEPERRSDPRAVARALEAWLRDPSVFSYTLKLDVVDPSLDPVEDFLVNRKEGHCEYFASALALLLRSVGVPSRMVNGFKGGDWNELARVMNVRQKHAHSWVEAYLGQSESDGAPVWLTLDPTPAGERDETVARVGGFRTNFRQITDLIRYVWVFYVVGYNAERQNKLLYGPIRQLLFEARRGFTLMGQMLTAEWRDVVELVRFRDARSFVSVRGFLVTFLGLLVLAGSSKVLAWLGGRVARWWRGPGDGADALLAGAAHYRRLAQLLAEFELERQPAETQEEFARRASLFLTGRGSDTAPVSDVPRVIVDAFYRIRYGQRVLSPESVSDLDARLDALEASLRAARA